MCSLPEIFTLVGKVLQFLRISLSENVGCKCVTICGCCLAVNGLSVIKVATHLGRSDFPGNVAIVQLPFWKKLCVGRLRCPVDPFRGFRV